jgi:uncharacterized RDD family membrane protein YckC
VRWPRRGPPGPPPGLDRRLVTPEGVALRLELAGAGTRALAFLIDFLIVMAALIAVTALLLWLGIGGGARGAAGLAMIWFLAFPLLRNAWFILSEAGGRAATPGKRAMGLRVVARDGGRLTVPAIAARNAMREIELYLPLTFLLAAGVRHEAEASLVLFGLIWTGIFLFFPLFNRDRLRIGDLVAGTWVVRNVRARLAVDLGREAVAVRRVFSDETLDLYGAFELQKASSRITMPRSAPGSSAI